MNPSTALARVIVDELVRGGVSEAVLSPGSRNAPLSYALGQADHAGRLRLHVRVDERSASYLALGLAKASGVPVPVVCTSGTAAAQLHGAVLEASHAGVPLIVLSADRPAELQGSGANQTTDQDHLFGSTVRGYYALAVNGSANENGTWRSRICRVLATSAGELDEDPGPVHLNVAFRDPLVPNHDAMPSHLTGRSDAGPWTQVSVRAPTWSSPYDGDAALGSSLPRTLLVLGEAPEQMLRQAAQLGRRRGWPIVAEPAAAAITGSAAIPHAALVLGAHEWVDAHRPDRVIVVGRPTLSRAVQQLLSRTDVRTEVVTASPRWADPSRAAVAVHHHSWLPAALRQPAPAPQGAWQIDGGPLGLTPAVSDEQWAADWRQAGERAESAVGAVLGPAWPSGPALAREMVAALPAGSQLVIGSSSPIRDVDLAVADWPPGTAVLANRGVSGIDGTASTALGAALAAQRVRPDVRSYALLGDLTLLHDSNGLLLGPREPRPNLTIVVASDDGGAIFGLLEHGAVAERDAAAAAMHERLFGTPTGADLAALCATTDTSYCKVTTPAELRAALAPAEGVRVVEVPLDRARARAVNEQLRTAVADALRPDTTG